VKDMTTLAAIVCMTALAAADLWLTHQSVAATAVISGLLGWMSHKTLSSTPNP